MGLLSLPLRLPLLPVTGLVRLAEVLAEQADAELQTAIRRQLEDAEFARASGRVSDDEIAQLEEQAVQRLIRLRRSDERAALAGQETAVRPHNDGS
jgi:hypothetical protein